MGVDRQRVRAEKFAADELAGERDHIVGVLSERRQLRRRSIAKVAGSKAGWSIASRMAASARPASGGRTSAATPRLLLPEKG